MNIVHISNYSKYKQTMTIMRRIYCTEIDGGWSLVETIAHYWFLLALTTTFGHLKWSTLMACTTLAWIARAKQNLIKNSIWCRFTIGHFHNIFRLLFFWNFILRKNNGLCYKNDFHVTTRRLHQRSKYNHENSRLLFIIIIFVVVMFFI